MNRPVTIVVLGKYPHVFNPFVESLEKYEPIRPIAFVRDGNAIPIPEESKWNVIQGPEKFSMAGNGNLGLKAVPEDHDILYCGDDVRFVQKHTIAILQEIAYSDEKIGLLSPRLIGRGSPTLCNPRGDVQDVRPIEMWFPCIYIKREVLQKIGYLDEIFSDFGSDDLDYCIRVKMAGYKLAVTSKVAVIHQASPEGGPTTFCKNIGVQEWQRQQQKAYEKLLNKWKVSPQNLEKFVATGDPRLMEPSTPEDASVPVNLDSSVWESGMLCTKEEAREFLKTRFLHVATPAYGGMMTVNYVNSLLALINMCHDLQIRHTIAFVYNESLITRARNKMAHDFLQNPEGTDFVFIDADIGFDPRDIVTMLMRKEDIIGAPCVRKNLRLDRIVDAVKRNGREYSMDELHQMIGEFVFNFPPNNKSHSMNLGQMTEVLDVGTGLMRVRKDTFLNIQLKFPDRWFLPMSGETNAARVPHYLFFQAGMDDETKETNPGGYPDYISEDYWFCRLARQAGMKVWLAPWLRTTHMGSYLFQGDLAAVAQSGGRLR